MPDQLSAPMGLRRELSQKDLLYWLACERSFELRRIKRPATPTHTPELRAAYTAGQAASQASATSNPATRAAIIDREIFKLPEEERAPVVARIQEMLVAADSSARNEDSGLRRERQLLWIDPITGWTLLATPDLSGSTGDFIQIVEEKHSYRIQPDHYVQAEFAALIAAQNQIRNKAKLPESERVYQDIYIKIRCSRTRVVDGERTRLWEKEYLYPREKMERDTARIREVIRTIERRDRSNYYLAKLKVKDCARCPVADRCAALKRNAPLLAQLEALRQKNKNHEDGSQSAEVEGALNLAQEEDQEPSFGSETD
jgi:hypothetical protein